MKRIITFYLIISLVLTIDTFAQLKDEVGHTVSQWSEWGTTACHKGIAWRSRQNFYGGNNGFTWEYEVKNNYGRQVAFSFKFGESGTAYRKTLTPNQVYKNTALPNASYFDYSVYSVCFSSDGRCKDDCYSPCDNGTPNIPNCNSSSTSSNTNSFNGSNQNSSQQKQGQSIVNQQEQERQQQELKRQQDAQRTAAYVDLGVQTVKGVFNVINAIKEDKRNTEERLRIKNEEKRATEALETEAMEKQWIIAKDYAKLNSTENIQKAIQIMLPYAFANKLNGSSLNTIGYWYWSLNDFTNSFKWFKEAAEQFDSNALYNLGTAYEKGQGVSKDLNISIKHYEDACGRGYNKGCTNTIRLAKEIAKNYSDLDNLEGYIKAIEITEKFVNNKNHDYSKLIDVQILNQLGFWYSKIKDVEKSGFWYKKSCDIGDIDGCEKYESMKKEIELKNQEIADLNKEIDLLLPNETDQKVNDSITVDKIIAKYYSAISKEKSVSDVKTTTMVWEEGGKMYKNITGIGKNYFESYNIKENYFIKSMYNGSEGYRIFKEKKEEMKKDEMRSYKNIKPLSIIIDPKAHLELGNIVKIGDEMCYAIIEKVNKKTYNFTNTNYFNLETGFLICSKMSVVYDDPKLNSNYYKFFKDYRAVEGILFPFSVLSFDFSKKYSNYSFKEIIVNDGNTETYFK